MDKLGKSKLIGVIVLGIGIFTFFYQSALAAIISGNVTITNYALNTSSLFNITSNTTGAIGHLLLSNDSSTTYLETLNGAKIFQMGDYTDDISSVLFVPNSSYRDFSGQGYGTWPSIRGEVNKMGAVLLPGSIYAIIKVVEVNFGVNATVQFRWNNESGNNTFGAITGCAAHTTFDSCLDDTTLDCIWRSKLAICEVDPFDFEFDQPPAECRMLPKFPCDGINNSFCTWDASLGTKGLCKEGASFDTRVGYNCSQIINHTVCINQTFTAKTGLCTWNTTSTACQENKTKTFSDIPDPPVFTCEAQGYVKNETKCDILANRYFMPCGFNNVSNRCEALFFDHGKFEDFEDISSENTCQLMGGFWKSEKTFNPLTDELTDESWCEFGVSVKSFYEFDQGSGFEGSSSRQRDCSRDCFGCEFNSSGTKWATQSDAKIACEASAAGCIFRADSNSFNGHGWCDPLVGFGGFDCDAHCGDCNLLTNASIVCQASPKGCRWDNISQYCIPRAEKGCQDQCMQCQDSTSCGVSTASGGCNWDASSNICTPQGGSFEICFDAVDNDNNGKTDCEDVKCGSDPFCGGSFADSNNCFQYDRFTYGNEGFAQTNCTNATGCTWINDSFGFSYCGPLSELCWTNESFFSDQAGCEGVGGGDVCTFISEGTCHENASLFSICSAITVEGTCDSTNGCKYKSFGVGGGFCDIATIVTCEANATLQSDQSACENAGCVWQGDSFGAGFEGFFEQNCVSPCIDSSISSQQGCLNATNGTGFYNGSCEWFSGRCEPKNFIGGCFDNDGDKTACNANSNCNFLQAPFAPLKNLNGSANFDDYHYSSETWMAAGLFFPNNESHYIINDTTKNTFIRLIMANDSVLYGDNVSSLYCNSTLFMNYSFTTGACTGTCDAYNNSATCGTETVHYYLNTTSKQLEVLWEVDVGDLGLDSSAGNDLLSNTANTTTVLVNGNLTEHVLDLTYNGTSAARVRTARGFCNDGQINSYFQGMDQDPPVPIAADTCGSDVPGHEYLDMCGLGVKKTPKAYMYGMPSSNMAGSAICNGVGLQGQSAGRGKNTSKYYLYLDTDGTTTGGCSPLDNSSLTGFEYMFKYVASIDSATNQLSETKISQKCSSGLWIASNIPIKTDKTKGCDFVFGPIIGIDKDTFTGKSNVNTSVGWRAYAASADANGNASVVNDTIGPGTGDFKGIDVALVDCTNPQGKDNAACTKFQQFGFFPGEFGPACTDSKDNDGDGQTDCDDFDCKYDPFFCGASGFSVQENDKSSPSLVWTKTNAKVPTRLEFIFDTNEPANGTVKFYNNDSACRTLNATALDKGLEDGLINTNYRPHHSATIKGLVPNSTYFYKYSVCDPSRNCALSKCSNATTSSSHTNITFKLVIPDNWTVDIQSINLTNYSAQYALKVSTEYINDFNLSVNNTLDDSSITFIGMSIFEKLTINLSQFLIGSNVLGLDAYQFQSLNQKTGVEKAVIRIPFAGTANTIEHCDDTGNNCQDVTDTLSCTLVEGYAECDVPIAVGLGFSTYKASTSSSSPGTSSSGGGGGSSGSSGGGIAIPKVSSTQSASEAFDTGQKVSLVMKQGGRYRFSINLEPHSVNLSKLYEDRISITVQSEPQTAVLYLNDRKEFDVTDDGVMDLAVGLESIEGASASLSLQRLNIAAKEEPIVTEPPESVYTEAEPFETPKEGQIPNQEVEEAVLKGALIALLIGIVLAVWIVRKKKRR